MGGDTSLQADENPMVSCRKEDCLCALGLRLIQKGTCLCMLSLYCPIVMIYAALSCSS